MFSNLKNKLIEEVKNSPSKFQQLAAQAQAAVSSTSGATSSGSLSGDSSQDDRLNSTNENFFSITEEDTPHNTPQNNLRQLPAMHSQQRSTPQALNNGATSTGAIPRTRKLSNSSIASDVSFRLPPYEAPATYHLQSDMESEYGSEFGDEAALNNKLDIISKEKLFNAYKSCLERYNKYRSRYSDLVKQYKELERDSTKARVVLLETQEKALRRINELREQCTLEKGAKVHLEQALRIEMDDMKCKIQAYETKLKLLGENPDNIKPSAEGDEEDATESLIDLENDNNQANNVSNGNGLVSINLQKEEEHSEALSKIAELEKELNDREEKLNELKEANEKLKKQEEEHAILSAQTKQAIHTELETKDREIKRLQEELKQKQIDIQNLAKKEAQLNGLLNENKKFKETLKQTTDAKREVEAKLITVEHMYNTLKQQNAAAAKQHNKDMDGKIKDYEHKLQDLRQQNGQLNEMLQRYQQNEISLAEIDNELNRTKNENHNLRLTLTEYEQKVEAAMNELKDYKIASEKERLQDNEKLDQLRKRIEELEEQIEMEKFENSKLSQKVENLEAELENVKATEPETETTITALKAEHENQMQSLREQLNSRDKELKSSGNKVAKHKKHHESQQHKIKEQTDELEKLRDELNKHAEHLQALHMEAREREEQTEIEKNQLKSQVTNIVQEISLMEEQMRIVQQSHAQLEAEKRQLELRIENMQVHSTSSNDNDQNNEQSSKIIELERQIESMINENSQLAERNCLLEENINRMEKVLAEQESHLETAENTIQKLNEKMSQVLDENSRMHNAQELMDHDHRTLQDKCDALEKEKLMIEDTRNLFESEIEILRSELTEVKDRLVMQIQNEAALNTTIEELRQEKENLLTQLDDGTRSVQDELMQLREKLREEEEMKSELLMKDESTTKRLKSMEAEVKTLQSQLEELEEYKKCCEKEKDCVSHELNMLKEQFEEKNKAFNELQKKYEEFENLKNKDMSAAADELNRIKPIIDEKNIEIEKLRGEIVKIAKERSEENESLKKELTELIDLEHRAVEQLEHQKANQMHKIEELEGKLLSANGDIDKLHENNVAFQLEIEQLNGKHKLDVKELTETLRRLQDDHSALQDEVQSTKEKSLQLSNYEQLKIENEYLSKHVQQLEEKLEITKLESASTIKENDDLKEKFKSLQCEMYVLKENAVEHETQFKSKQTELDNTQNVMRSLQSELETHRLELARQSEHSSYINEKNDSIQKELLSTQQILTEAQQKLEATQSELEILRDETKSKQHEQQQLDALNEECERNRLTIETLNKDVSDLTQVLREKELLEAEIKDLKVQQEQQRTLTATIPNNSTSLPLSFISENASQSNNNDAAEQLRDLNTALQHELEKLKQSSTAEIINLQHEIEDHKRDAKENANVILQLKTMRSDRQNDNVLEEETTKEYNREIDKDELQKANADLDAKLKEIMNEVQDVSNRNLFLEQKCENYLILEQSNERLKLQNAKLSRQLDETLVSMQHNESINANTEFEYLKNIMFQYLTGTVNGNNETLVKVISAVLKFSPQQTQVALEKEHQRRSLLNKII